MHATYTDAFQDRMVLSASINYKQIRNWNNLFTVHHLNMRGVITRAHTWLTFDLSLDVNGTASNTHAKCINPPFRFEVSANEQTNLDKILLAFLRLCVEKRTHTYKSKHKNGKFVSL